MDLPLRNVKVGVSKVSYGVGLFPIEKINKGEIVFNFTWDDFPFFLLYF